MKTGKPARALLRVLAVLAVLTAFVVLDWYPTVKELGRFRRERSDMERKIKNYAAMADAIQFSDQGEDSLLADADAEVRQALPLVENDDGWLDLARRELLERGKSSANPILVFSEAEAFAPEPAGLRDWLILQEQDIRHSFRAADPLYGAFPLSLANEGHLASQPLGVALGASLPKLLDFINRVSWGAARLEIVRLRLEPSERFFRAWLICRGGYRVPGPSVWLAGSDRGEGGEEMLIDLDSPLLLRQADPLLAPRVEKRELPPAGSPW